MTFRLRSKNIRGLETAWLEDGETGPILLMLHGYPDSAEIWGLQLDHFSNQFRVVCPFSRGVGASEKCEDYRRYGTDAVALDLFEILRSVDPSGKQTVFVVGHDLGAILAWKMAGLLGERLGGLVIFNGLSLAQIRGRFTNPRQLMKSWYVYLMQLPKVPELAAKFLPNTIQSFAYQVGGLEKEMRPDVENEHAGIENGYQQYRAFARELIQKQTGPIPVTRKPTLLIFGNEDPFVEPPTMDEIEPYAPELAVRILEGKHWIFREKADEVNLILQDFFMGAGVMYGESGGKIGAKGLENIVDTGAVENRTGGKRRSG